MSLDDAFLQEDEHVERVFQEGYAAGCALGYSTAFDIGAKQGHAIRHELGYMQSCCELVTSVLQANGRAVSTKEGKVLTVAADVQRAIAAFPVGNPKAPAPAPGEEGEEAAAAAGASPTDAALSPSSALSSPEVGGDSEVEAGGGSGGGGVDVLALLQRIRARFKLLCSLQRALGGSAAGKGAADWLAVGAAASRDAGAARALAAASDASRAPGGAASAGGAGLSI